MAKIQMKYITWEDLFEDFGDPGDAEFLPLCRNFYEKCLQFDKGGKREEAT